MVITKLYTAEDLWEMGEDAHFELVLGELREYVAAGERHGDVSVELVWQLLNFTRERRLQKVVIPETGFIISRNPDTVLVPDAAFIHEDRLPVDRDERKFIPLPPDFAVEIMSPSNTRDDIAEKVALYLAAGVALVWVIDPERRTVAIHTPGLPEQVAYEGDTVDGAPVLPGFRVAVADLFTRPD
jgi:Uma2 family endonuclease